MLTAFDIPSHRLRELVVMALAVQREPVTAWRLAELVAGETWWSSLDSDERAVLVYRVKNAATDIAEVQAERAMGSRTYYSLTPRRAQG